MQAFLIPTKLAEIDYLVVLHGKVIPIEVKAGFGSTLYSLHAFLTHHTKSPYGIKFSAHNYSIYHHENMYDLQSYPLYAIAQVMSNNDPEMKAAIENLISQ